MTNIAEDTVKEEDVVKEETEETVIVKQEATGDAFQQPDSNSHEGSDINILLGLGLSRRFYYPLSRNCMELLECPWESL